ncbi:hypothetical protein HHI36_013273 [Cryptolaemus montrouzieri]|uniref:Zinc finger PHD-type domain-containing protein n=1 Tax=Cryptolaemus montrouzieri TaxID=559131 RepID=A0ABD2NHT0_9CUCU
MKTGNKSSANKKKVTKKKKASVEPSIEDIDSEIENTLCLYCNGCYLESNEGWAVCSACGKWAHCGCAGIDDEDEDATFTSEFCQQKLIGFFQTPSCPLRYPILPNGGDKIRII